MSILWVTMILVIYLLTFLILLTKRQKLKSFSIQGISRIAIVLGYLAVSALFLGLFPRKEEGWQELNTAKIDQYVNNNQTVVATIGADWCITCQINTQTLASDRVFKQSLGADNIVIMKGDWTLEDVQISRFLHYNGQSGVPFNIVFGPNAPDGIILPVILTHANVRQAVGEAAGENPASSSDAT